METTAAFAGPRSIRLARPERRAGTARAGPVVPGAIRFPEAALALGPETIRLARPETAIFPGRILVAARTVRFAKAAAFGARTVRLAKAAAGTGIMGLPEVPAFLLPARPVGRAEAAAFAFAARTVGFAESAAAIGPTRAEAAIVAGRSSGAAFLLPWGPVTTGLVEAAALATALTRLPRVKV